MYVIVSDYFENDRMYLSWQPDTWDDGYFWTSIECFKECLSEGLNTASHRFAFDSYREAAYAMHSLDIPSSWNAYVIKIEV